MQGKIIFHALGHENVLSFQENTLEFTKDEGLSKKGDCIIGVKADFCLPDIKEFLSQIGRDSSIVIRIRAGGLEEEISAAPNFDFSSEDEMVIRKSDFVSERTLGIFADKSAAELSRAFVEKLKSPSCEITVEIMEGPSLKRAKIVKVPF
jgi:hypothetical protein